MRFMLPNIALYLEYQIVMDQKTLAIYLITQLLSNL